MALFLSPLLAPFLKIMTTPKAPKVPHTITTHGHARTDNYFWMREKDKPELLDYIHAENNYTNAGLAHTKALQAKLYEEMVGRIQETDQSVPVEKGGYLYYTRTEEGLQYSIYCRKQGNMQAAEEVLLNPNEIAAEADSNYLRVGIYEHSSAGRDIYQGLFESLGAEVISLERTDEFVPIDTEAVAESDKEKARFWSKQYSLDFIFSTDGDGDRPLVADEKGEWLRGDILGLLCAEAMNIEALAIPVSCNTLIEQSSQFKTVSKTKIGSPYVIAEFVELNQQYSSVAGFEANGGFFR